MRLSPKLRAVLERALYLVGGAVAAYVCQRWGVCAPPPGV